MSKKQYEFQGEKLKLLREMNLMTLTDLQKKVGVSFQVISDWENNKKRPTFENILKLEDVFNMPRSFFFQTEIKLLENENISFFRKQAAVAKKYQVQVERIADYYSIIEKSIRKRVSLPSFDTTMQYKSVDIGNVKFEQIDFEDIDELALSIRDKFSLGNGPIANMTLLCEKLGVRVLFSDMNSSKIDALTKKIDNQYYIVLNSERTSSARIRFNIAHELGHILLHSYYEEKVIKNLDNNKRIEAEANFFASCLLLPEEGFSLDLAYSNLSYLVSLKKHWLVSIQAMIYRGEQLGLITGQHALHLRQQISRNKWRINEPLDDEIPIEYPTLLKKAVEFIKKKSITEYNKMIFETGVSEAKFLELISPRNVKEIKEPNLKLI